MRGRGCWRKRSATSAAQDCTQFRCSGNDALGEGFQFGLVVALVARLERYLDRQRFLTLGDARAAEVVEQAGGDDIGLVTGADRADEITAASATGTRNAKSRVIACNAGGV